MAAVAEIYENYILRHVHHSTCPIDTLVEDLWTNLQQNLVIGEKVQLGIKISNNPITGRVSAIHESTTTAKVINNVSPSSDKENKDDDTQLLPHKYSIQLDNDTKVISHVPSSDIQRKEKCPPRNAIRSYIASHASQCGRRGNILWAVEDEYLKKFCIKDKIARMFISPNKGMASVFSKDATKTSRKRKISTSLDVVAAGKKVKLNGDMTAVGESHRSVINDSCRLIAEKRASEGLVDGAITGDIKLKIAVKNSHGATTGDNVQKNGRTRVKTVSQNRLKAKSSNNRGRPSKNKAKNEEVKSTSRCAVDATGSSSDEDVALSSLKDMDNVPLVLLKKLSPSKNHEVTNSCKKGDGPTEKRAPLKKDVGRTDESAKKKLKFDSLGKKSLKDSTKKNNGKLKQMTLFDLKNKPKSESPNSQIKRSPRKISPAKTPGIIVKLLKSLEADDKNQIKIHLKKAAMTLTAIQRSRLSVEVKDMVNKRYERIQERNMLSKMSAEERAEYKRQKLDKARRLGSMKQKKFEDTLLKLKPLPAPHLVPTPEGMPNEYFGDIAMLCEFIACYSTLLLPEGQGPITPDDLMTSLVSNSLPQAIVILLQTLLQDPIAKDYKEIGVHLHDIPVSIYTASELIRLCLRTHDDDDEDDNIDDDDVEDAVIENLEVQGFSELALDQKMHVLRVLFLRIMNTYSVQDHIESMQSNAAKLWMKRCADSRARVQQGEQAKKIGTSENTGENETANSPEGAEVKKETNISQGLTLNHFYGTKSEAADTPDTSGTEDGPADVGIVAKLRRRRELAARAGRDKELQDALKKSQLLKAMEEERKEREEENNVRASKAANEAAHLTLRRVPLGTDRNHSRYWELSGLSPGLYVEKGWFIGDTITVTNDTDDSDAENDYSDITFPHSGQNLWFVYTDPGEINTLISALHPQGNRESRLRQALTKRKDDILASLKNDKRNGKGDVKVNSDVLEAFKEELSDTELRLRNGGLGGVTDFPGWQRDLADATDIDTLQRCLIDVERNVLERFRQGIMGKKEHKKRSDENHEDLDDEEVAPKGIVVWEDNVLKCRTISRLHVLLCVLDNSIRWEKSAENAKCRICRRIGDEAMLLCDECNSPYHLFCLRPAIHVVPEGDWLCPACIPTSERRRSRGAMRDVRRPVAAGSSDGSDGGSDTEEEENVEMVHETECAVCGCPEGEVIACIRCPSIYHLECHEPPLRHAPRGKWECAECKSGGRRKTSQGHSRGRVPPKKQVEVDDSGKVSDEETEVEHSSDESNDETTEYNDSSDEEEIVRPSHSRGARTPRVNHRNSLVNSRARTTQKFVDKPRGNTRNGRDYSKGQGDSARSRRESGRSRVRNGLVNEADDEFVDGRKARCNRGPSYVSICEEILALLSKHESSWPFQERVSKKDVPDYFTIIHTPMDLSKVRDKLMLFHYPTPDLFIADVTLIFQNAATYNSTDSEVYQCMERLQTEFKHLLTKYLPDYAPSSPDKGRGSSTTQQRRARVIRP